MSEDFDPYYKWLAIPPKDQPPNHYRLLGLEALESDDDVIANAADARMSHLRVFQSGEHVAESQRLLNEIATARTCLLNSAKKEAYDADLRIELGADEDSDAPEAAVDEPSAEPADPFPSINMSGSVVGTQKTTRPPRPGTGTTASRPSRPSSPTERKPNQHAKKISIIGHVAAPILGLLVGAIILWFVKPDIFGGGEEIPVDEDQTVHVDEDRTRDRDFRRTSSRDRNRKDNGRNSTRNRNNGGQVNGSTNTNNNGNTTNGGAATTTNNDSDTTNNNSSNGGLDDPNGFGGIPNPGGFRDPIGTTDGGQDPIFVPPVRDPVPPEPTPEEKRQRLQSDLEKAEANGDAKSALRYAGLLAEHDGIDVLQAKLTMFERLQTSFSSESQFKSLAEAGFALLDDAVTAANGTVAKKVATATLLAARASKDNDLVRKATLGVIKAQQAGG